MEIKELNEVSRKNFGVDFEDLRSGYQKEAVYNFIRYKEYKRKAEAEEKIKKIKR